MPDSTRITLQDIAHALGVPIDQVMKVVLGQPDVSEELRQKVFAALQEAGLVRLSHETSAGTLGIVFPGTLIGDYVGMVVRGISETAKQRGYSVVLCNERSSKAELLDQLLGNESCKGVISVVPNQYSRVLERCHHHGRDYVLVDYQGDEELEEALTVEVKNRESMIEVVNHLLELGHQRLGFITGRMAHASARQRLQGYLDALDGAGIPYDGDLVREGNWVHEDGYEQALGLLALNDPPTAIVASNDLMAFGAIQAAREHGLEIGSDISISGFDDIEMASTITPPLTTVRQPMFGLGEAAVDLLVGGTQERHVRLDTEFIVRQSTGPISERA